MDCKNLNFTSGKSFNLNLFQSTRLDSFSTTLSTMINGIKDKETISEFENLLDNLVFADLISIHEQDVYLEQINANLDWQGVHYHEVKVFFGLAEPTSKFYQLLIVIQNYFF